MDNVTDTHTSPDPKDKPTQVTPIEIILAYQNSMLADLDAQKDTLIAQINQVHGAITVLRKLIDQTQYILSQTQPSTVDSSDLATEEETQQVADGLTVLANRPKVAQVKPYRGKTADVWQAKNEAN